MNLNYLMRVLGGASFKKMKEAINTVHEKSGKSKFTTFFDMLGCSMRYGAGYNDYIIFEFYKMNGKQRKTYMTRMKNKWLISHMNDEQYVRIFDEKNLFDKKFAPFMGREILDLAEIDFPRFEQFLGKGTVELCYKSRKEFWCYRGSNCTASRRCENLSVFAELPAYCDIGE